MTRCSLLVSAAMGCAAACGGTTLDRSGRHDRPDSGMTSTGGNGGGMLDASVGGSGGSSGSGGGPVGSTCTTDADCATGLVCELDRCMTPASVQYPATAAPPVSTIFPTTCFASDLGLLEIRLTPPAGQTSFGRSVLLDGDRLAVGTAYDVVTYRGNGLAWTEEGVIPLREPYGFDALALSGDTLAAGFMNEDTNGVIQTGALHVYTLGADGGTAPDVVVPTPLEEFFHFGSAIALESQYMAVTSSKAVDLFVREPGGWSKTQELVPDTSAPAALTVALHGSVLAVGAYWYLASDGMETSAVFLYRNSGGIFALEDRIDPGTPDASFGYRPVLGDDLLVTGSDRPSVYAKGAAGWALETQLGDGSSLANAIDGSRVAINGDLGIRVFERSGGAWPMTLTVKNHDVGASQYFGGPLALHGDVLAAGNEGNDGNGASAGAVYTFTKTATSSQPDCALSAMGPARIQGAGTGCVEPGSGIAKCPFVAPGMATVAGMTPYGAIGFPFAWTDVVGGFVNSFTVEFSNVTPRREGTSPKLGFTIQGAPSDIPTSQPIQTAFTLTLCSRTVTVDGIVTFDETVDGGAEPGPLTGSIAIERDGWTVKGTFRIDVYCSFHGTH